jgi:ketopantoate reductase
MLSSSSIVLIGIGEMGGVFAKALLRAGHTITPVNRGSDLGAVESVVPEPALVLVTVGEADLHPVLDRLPTGWKSRVGLIQNELLPRDWESHGVTTPTVGAVWFEKKPEQDVKVIIPTPIWGPAAQLVADGLESIDIPAQVISDAEAMTAELVRKNLYILTANIGGLVSGGTVSHLWTEHNDLARTVADEVLSIQEWLVGGDIDRPSAVAGMVEAFEADPEHKATGRSAPARLVRALGHAAEAGIAVPTLASIGHEHAPLA